MGVCGICQKCQKPVISEDCEQCYNISLKRYATHNKNTVRHIDCSALGKEISSFHAKQKDIYDDLQIKLGKKAKPEIIKDKGYTLGEFIKKGEKISVMG